MIPQLSPMMWMIFPLILGFILLSLVGVVDNKSNYICLDNNIKYCNILNKEW